MLTARHLSTGVGIRPILPAAAGAGVRISSNPGAPGHRYTKAALQIGFDEHH